MSRRLHWPANGQGRAHLDPGRIWLALWDGIFAVFLAGLQVCAGSWAGGAGACLQVVGASLVAQVVKSIFLQCRKLRFDPCNAEDAEDSGSVPGLGRFPGGGNGNPLQYSCLESPWTKEPGGLQSMGLQRVRHNLATELQAQALLLGGACPCSDKLFGLRRPSMDTWRLLGRAGSWH